MEALAHDDRPPNRPYSMPADLSSGVASMSAPASILNALMRWAEASIHSGKQVTPWLQSAGRYRSVLSPLRSRCAGSQGVCS